MGERDRGERGTRDTYSVLKHFTSAQTSSSSNRRSTRTRIKHFHHGKLKMTMFSSRNNFAIWKGEVTDPLVNDDLIEALEKGKPGDIGDRKACGNIKN